MLFDIATLVQELKTVAAEIREAKRFYNTPKRDWTKCGKLPQLRARANLLCTLRAHTRKRVHKAGSTLEVQEKWLSNLYAFREFEREVPSHAA